MSTSPRGFTLIELTIALALTGGVIAMAASGLVALMAKDRQTATDRANRYELQRTMDFMGNEIRMATRISPCPQQDALAYQPATHSQNAQPILVLWMPTASGLSQPIVYYLAIPPLKPKSVWSGPLVLYRWGPTLNLDGDYSKKQSTYNYYNEVVVDQITRETLVKSCPDSHPINGASDAGLALCLTEQGRSAQLTLGRYSHNSAKLITAGATFSLRSRSLQAQGACPNI